MRPIDADAVKYEPLPKGERNYRTFNLDDAYEDGYNDAMFDIHHAPTIDVPNWIPCKERLPEVGADVLFSVKKGRYVSEGSLRTDGYWEEFRGNGTLPGRAVSAWMPLPEPYKGTK